MAKITHKDAVVVSLLLAMSGASSAGNNDTAPNLDPQADALLKKMSGYMGGLKSFSADAFVFDEQIMSDGFKLSLLQSGSIAVKRPDKLHITRKGMVRDQEVFFDGSRLVVHGKRLGMAIEVPMSGDLEAALDAATETFGAELPGRDLISADAYTPLMEPVQESAYLGTVEIGDMTCRQLAFRTEEVDWQLWVAEGEHPLPCRYTITSKWTYGAPQYTVSFANWQVNPQLPAGNFVFTQPESTQKVTVEEFRKAIQKGGDE